MKMYLAVMAGGALGAGGRLWLSTLLAMRFGETFPIGTLAVNALGCFILGLFTGLTGPDGIWVLPPLTRQFVTIGVLGGFTTFSSFGLQTFQLMSDGEWAFAGLNILLSVVVCLLAVWLGIVLTALLTSR